jgi:flagellin
VIINTLSTDVRALRQLSVSSADGELAMQRMSSGSQLNRTADNAAGRAISSGLLLQIKSSEQAARNLNDGISLVQVAQGAMGEVDALFQRMRELSLQSLNGTYTDANREQMDLEFQTLYQQVRHISETTRFNGQTLLNVNGTIGLQGSWELSEANRLEVRTIDLLESVGDITYTVPGTPGTDDTLQFAAPGGFDTGLLGLGLAADKFTLNLMGVQSVTVKNLGLLPLSGADIYASNGADANQKIANFINADSALQSAGFSAVYHAGDGSLEVLSNSRDMVAGDIGWSVNVDVGAPLSFSSSVIAGTPPTPDTEVTIPGATIGDIKTVNSAAESLLALDLYMERSTAYRGELGAMQNRLNYSMDVLLTANDNFAATRSRITDADYAVETARLARSRILTDSGQAMLAQAHDMSESVIGTLLR